jgi:dienelactone hydrolase
MRPIWTLLAASAGIAAQTVPSSEHTMACLRRQARAITERAAAEVSDRTSWERVRSTRVTELRDMLGLLPWPDRTPLNVQVTAKSDRGSYTVENIAFESMPRIYVTANLYVPKQRRGRVPAVVYVCGHSYSPFGDKAQYQRHGISLAKNGYVAIILDSIQIAETFALHHGTYSQDMYDWYARAYSPAGVEVWNAMRAIDYLESRPEVDPERIGMTGRSGGAAMTWFTAALDPRVKVAAPVMGISTYGVNLEHNTQQRHCDCMFPVNFARQDLLHLGALIAPRPLFTAHGRTDDLFPMPGVEEFEQKIGTLYKSYGREVEFRNVVVETGHQDSDFLREQAIHWFDRYLMRIDDRKLDMSVEAAHGEELAVFRNGPPKDAANYRIHETFLPTPGFRTYSRLEQWSGRRQELLDRLRAVAFGGVTRVAEPKLQPSGDAGASGFDAFEVSFEQDVPVRLLLTKATAQKLPAVLYIASDGDDPRAIATLLNPLGNGQARKAVLYPRGVGETGWSRTLYRDVMRNAMHTGRTVDSMRLDDVLGAVAMLEADPGVDAARITVMGKGTAAGLALYAAILNENIEQVVLFQPPSTHVEGPFFLGVLRYTDLPEAAALVAPRRVLFYNRMPPAFEATRSIFGLYGKPLHLGVTMSIQGPVLGKYDHDYASGW